MTTKFLKCRTRHAPSHRASGALTEARGKAIAARCRASSIVGCAVVASTRPAVGTISDPVAIDQGRPAVAAQNWSALDRAERISVQKAPQDPDEQFRSNLPWTDLTAVQTD